MVCVWGGVLAAIWSLACLHFAYFCCYLAAKLCFVVFKTMAIKLILFYLIPVIRKIVGTSVSYSPVSLNKGLCLRYFF